MKSFYKKKDNITFTVDYRTELLSVILVLSDNYKKMVGNKMQPLNNKYIYDRIIERFSKYKNHKVMILFEDIIKKHKYFNYDAPITLFLSLDEDLKCDKLNDYLFNTILEKDNLIYDFIDELKNFSIDINFDDYYLNNKNEYNMFIDTIYDKHINNNLDVFLNEFFKEKKELFVNAIPFNSMSCYSSFIGDKVYSNIGVTQLSKENNLYENWELYKGDMLLVSLHEFCHSYVNPLTEKYISNNNLDYLIDDNMHRFAYDDALTVINENVVRAIVLYYEKKYLTEKYEKDYNKEKELGFKYIDNILEVLKDNEDFETTFKEKIVKMF